MEHPPFKRTRKLWVLIPLFGSLVFILLYLIAAILYPGGSQANKYSSGFSWTDNYWCNLLNTNAINGDPNPGRPFGMASALVLSVTLIIFWWMFPRILNFARAGKLMIQVSGASSMMVVLFLSSRYHDTILNIAVLLSLFALAGTFMGLYKMKWYSLFVFGAFNLLLVVVNNMIYYSGDLDNLPVIQKITFLSFLLWICLIDLRLYRVSSSQHPDTTIS